MRYFSLALLCLAAGCGTPEVSAKQEWIKSIGSFSFVPLYPMREDVFVGDIRIHRLDQKSTGLHSRPVARLASAKAGLYDWSSGSSEYAKGAGPDTSKPGVVTWSQPGADKDIFRKSRGADRLRLMALPKIDVTRITKAKAKASGLIGLWNAVIGVNHANTEHLYVALTGLETVEIPDHKVATPFLNKVKNMMKDPTQRTALCVAAISMGDPHFKRTAISLVTRVGYARGVEYTRRSDTFTAFSGNASKKGTDKTEVDVDNVSSETKSSQSLYEVFERPLAFGVDAIMIQPTEAYKLAAKEHNAGNPKNLMKPDLKTACDEDAGVFVVSPFAPVLTGAPKRTGDT